MPHVLFGQKLQELYFVETTLVEVLPRLAEKVRDSRLQALLLEHAEETQQQVMRLQEAFGIVGQTPAPKTVPHFEQMLSEVNENIESGSTQIDLTIIAGGLETEHTEMGMYEAVCALAKRLNISSIPELLEASLKEEEGAAKKLLSLVTP